MHRLAVTALVLVPLLSPPIAAQDVKIGYTDTPVIAGQTWRVHDSERPRPKIVAPGTNSTPSQPGSAPSDAVVLFDGKNLGAWTGRGGVADWKVENGYMEVNRSGDIRTKQAFGSCQLHIEFLTPTPAVGDSQGRGNSGVFFFDDQYEVQVLDSFENPTYADGQAGALYGQVPPMVNASRKPGEWQSFDIIFTAPRFATDGELLSAAFATVLHNGVLLHHHRQLVGPTMHRAVADYKPHPPKGSIKLQDHGNPVRYRNIWVREIGDSQPK